ncbi:NADH-quinone oxidoreductase subunit A [Pontibacter sp. JH31]|jgi:NADH-quinone oxidoreductase subunit A|uniref:NADH-quinone oxidoreductase subunit A n=1 Tax=Pontibacter aquaedesilientis TaxID=2766980 RepID=A0ABR7XE84_9BACT|nr:NADH-quinone oxidoreductase subunit A [Pontibacter aquaedesilientis]MBD1396600.1 NADH-quinone oxidoreductase subunit A [Pontibacter aquaedesilientis]
METTGTQYLPSDYLPILIQFAAALGFVIFALVVTHLLGPKRKSEVKDNPWESGVESVGDARTPISYKYFITAILFVLFDIEIIFMYPWAVNFREFGLEGFLPMMLFLGVILAGFFYEIKKGILK